MNLNDLIASVEAAAPDSHPTRVAIDGFCAAGKTTLADELAAALRERGHTVIRAGGDDFQNPREVRWQLGARSAEGFYRHAMDFTALRRELLGPLGPGGSLDYRTTYYDVFASRPNVGDLRRAEPDAILILDGLFLHSPAIRDAFDFTILLAPDLETCLTRALQRRQERIDDPDEIIALYRERYMPGWRMYLEEINPERWAGVVVR